MSEKPPFNNTQPDEPEKAVEKHAFSDGAPREENKRGFQVMWESEDEKKGSNDVKPVKTDTEADWQTKPLNADLIEELTLLKKREAESEQPQDLSPKTDSSGSSVQTQRTDPEERPFGSTLHVQATPDSFAVSARPVARERAPTETPTTADEYIPTETTDSVQSNKGEVPQAPKVKKRSESRGTRTRRKSSGSGLSTQGLNSTQKSYNRTVSAAGNASNESEKVQVASTHVQSRAPQMMQGEQPRTPKGIDKSTEDTAKEGATESQTSRPESPQESTVASVPFMITQEYRGRLLDIGRTPAEIRSMTPQEAHDILNQSVDTAKTSEPSPELESSEEEAPTATEKEKEQTSEFGESRESTDAGKLVTDETPENQVEALKASVQKENVARNENRFMDEQLEGLGTPEAIAQLSPEEKREILKIHPPTDESVEEAAPTTPEETAETPATFKEARDQYKQYRAQLDEVEKNFHVAAEAYEAERNSGGLLARFTSNSLAQKKEQMQIAQRTYDKMLDTIREQRQHRLELYQGVLKEKREERSQRAAEEPVPISKSRPLTERLYEQRVAKYASLHEAILERKVDQDVQFVERIRLSQNEEGESRNRFMRNTKAIWGAYRKMPFHKKVLWGTGAAAAAGLALGASGVVAGGAVGAAATFGARRLVGGTLGMGAAIGTKLGVDKYAEHRESGKMSEQHEQFTKKSLSASRDERLKIRKDTRNIKRAGTVAAAGVGITVGSGATGVVGQLQEGVEFSDVSLTKGVTDFGSRIKVGAGHIKDAVTGTEGDVSDVPETGSAKPPAGSVETEVAMEKQPKATDYMDERMRRRYEGNLRDGAEDNQQTLRNRARAADLAKEMGVPYDPTSDDIDVVGRRGPGDFMKSDGVVAEITGKKVPIELLTPEEQKALHVATKEAAPLSPEDQAKLADLSLGGKENPTPSPVKEAPHSIPRSPILERAEQASELEIGDLFKQWSEPEAFRPDAIPITPDQVPYMRPADMDAAPVEPTPSPEHVQGLAETQAERVAEPVFEKRGNYTSFEMSDPADPNTKYTWIKTPDGSESWQVTRPSVSTHPSAGPNDSDPIAFEALPEEVQGRYTHLANEHQAGGVQVDANGDHYTIGKEQTTVAGDAMYEGLNKAMAGELEAPENPVVAPEASESISFKGTYEAGSSIERELQQLLEKTNPELTKAERGVVAHLIELEIEKDPVAAEALGVKGGNFHNVGKGDAYEYNLDRTIVDGAVEKVRGGAVSVPEATSPAAPIQVASLESSGVVEAQPVPTESAPASTPVEAVPGEEPGTPRKGDFPYQFGDDLKEATAQLPKTPDYLGTASRPAIETLFKTEDVFSKMLLGQRDFIRSNWGPISHVRMKDLFDAQPGLTYNIDGTEVTLSPQTEGWIGSMLQQITSKLEDRVPNMEALMEDAKRSNVTFGSLIQKIANQLNGAEAEQNVAELAPEAAAPTHTADVAVTADAESVEAEAPPVSRSAAPAEHVEKRAPAHRPRTNGRINNMEAEVVGAKVAPIPGGEVDVAGRLQVEYGGTRAQFKTLVDVRDKSMVSQAAHDIENKYFKPTSSFAKVFTGDTYHPEWDQPGVRSDSLLNPQSASYDPTFAKVIERKLYEMRMYQPQGRTPRVMRYELSPQDMQLSPKELLVKVEANFDHVRDLSKNGTQGSGWKRAYSIGTKKHFDIRK